MESNQKSYHCRPFLQVFTGENSRFRSLSCKIERMTSHARLLPVLFACFYAIAAASAVAPQATPRPRLVTATPTPLPTATPAPSPTPVQTLEELRAKISRRLFSPEVRRGRVGVKIVSLSTGKSVFEVDTDKYFMPASNMKNFTVAAALEKLGPDFKFVTSVYANAKPDANGTITGDLRLYGRGDVSISTLFATRPSTDPEIYYERLDRLADAIVAAGIKRIDGSLVADESYFTGNPVPLTWEWDDLQWDDGAEISAFPINNNSMDLNVKGTRSGQPCAVSILPPTALYQVTNICTTGGAQRGIVVKKSLERNSVTVSGTMPAGQSWTGYITVTHPAELFISLLKERLVKKGVAVTGGTRTILKLAQPDAQHAVEVVRFESAPFREVAAKTMKPSQNMFTETILWTLGEQIERRSSSWPDSSTLGLNVVRSFMDQAGIPADSVIQYDGSGLSRHNLVTPNAVVTLYTYMANQSRNAQVWRDSLTIGGVDGTLRNRFRGTVAAGNIRGKTGTLDQVSALSGYVTTAGGEQLVVSILVNNVAGETRTRTSLIDDIVVALANFNGKID